MAILTACMQASRAAFCGFGKARLLWSLTQEHDVESLSSVCLKGNLE